MLLPMPFADHLKKHAEAMREYNTGDYTNLQPEERKKKATEVRNLSAAAASALAPMPIPFAHVWAITPVQLAMVRAIGNIYGYKLDKRAVQKELLPVIGGGVLGKTIFLELMKLGLPGVGGVGSAAFVWVWTQSMGRVAEAFYANGMRPGREQLDDLVRSEADRSTDELEIWLGDAVTH